MTLVLIAEIDMITAQYIAGTLDAAGFETRATDSQTDAMAIYQERRADLVFTNYYLGDGSGVGLLKALAKVDPDFLGVMATGIGSEDIAREAMLSGASDYVVKNGDFYRNLPEMAGRFVSQHRESLDARKARTDSERLEAQVELAGWLDHNFKNILSAATGFLSLLDFGSERQTDEKRREYVSDTLEALRTAMKLLDRLSALGHSGSREGARQALVAQVADDAYRSARDPEKSQPEDRAALASAAARTNFINRTRLLPPQRVVFEDLFTVFEALFRNSLESLTAVGEGPEISVSAEREGPYLVVEVADNGRGMDEKVLRRVFDPLFSTKGQVGVGVSLTIVKTLVQRHLGEITVKSDPGRGTLFRFTYFVGEDDLSPSSANAGW
ncbi:MAG: hybrid sensor histidine kinase/response regulator [Deltaproteobacteria bacterium]|nr:hybrid sensor histidine kinase/response regulator [Deltaproteobacteria bacterium]